MTNAKPKLVGLNHVAVEVDDVETALEFYGKIFEFTLRGTHRGDDGALQMAFIDMGDQFLAISRGRTQAPDTGRHFGLVVDDRTVVMDLAIAAGASVPEGRLSTSSIPGATMSRSSNFAMFNSPGLQPF